MTTAVPIAELREQDLGNLGAVLGSGGQAVVYDVPQLALPCAPHRLVYKRYRPGFAPRTHTANSLIMLRELLDDQQRQRLDTVTAWPLRVVTGAQGVCGVVLPRIPDSFFQDVTLPSGRADMMVREVQHLFVDPDRCRRIGMAVPTWEQRLEICRDLSAALTFLHGPGIDVVFGDINAKNQLFRLGAEPTVMFVDCDAVRIRGGVTGSPQLNAPDWTPPEGPRALSRHTDQYKLGLFVLRCLTPGSQGSTRTNPADAAAVLDARGIALLTAALTGPSAGRPSADDWLRYLSRLLGEPLEPPTLEAVEPARTIVAAGEPVTVRWAARDADVVEVSVLGCATVVADAGLGAGSVEVRPVRTAALTVVARNACGVDESRTPAVAVVDVPRWAELPVPVPQLRLPDLALPDLPGVGPVLALTSFPLADFTTPGDLPAACAPAPVLPAPPVPGLDFGDTGPVDVLSIICAGPDLDDYPARGSVDR